jgi:hypothetical protein
MKFERLFKLYKIKYEITEFGNKCEIKHKLPEITIQCEWYYNKQFPSFELEVLLADMYRGIKKYQKKEFIKTLPKNKQKLIKYY